MRTEKTQVLTMADESTYDDQRKYLRWHMQVLALAVETIFDYFFVSREGARAVRISLHIIRYRVIILVPIPCLL